MKTIFIGTIVCLIFIPDLSHGALPTCQDDTGCPDNAACPGAGQECTCSDGFHLNSTGDGCAEDIQAGLSCTQNDSDTECVDNAKCVDTAEAGQPESLKCTCNSGYQETSGTCRPGSGTTCIINGTACVEGANCQNTAAAGSAEALQCVCSADWHEMSSQQDVTICEEDIKAGLNCTQNGNDTECVDNAKCMDVAEEGQAESLKCTCNSGYLEASGTCRPVIQAGGDCSQMDNETTCVDNAMCVNETATDGSGSQSQTCTCDSGYLAVSGACLAVPGTECLDTEGGECVEGASCQDKAEPDAESPVLRCECSMGWHGKANEQNITVCEADIGPGEACTAENDTTECIANATCMKTEADDLQCTCDQGSHQVKDQTGKQICVENACGYTVDTCKAGGMATCADITALIGCLLGGLCQADVAGDRAMFFQALEDVQPHIPADCDVADQSTCKNKVSSCLIQHLKQNVTDCTSIQALGTCVTAAKASCPEADDQQVVALAQARHDDLSSNFSCECISGIESCRSPQLAVLQDENTEDTAKCSAVKELFGCAMVPGCDVSKAVDQSAVSNVWSQAMTYATDHDCKETITEADASTCALQLTRCALIYGEERPSNGSDKLKECKAAKAFGSCLELDTAQCTAASDIAVKQLFKDQHNLVSITCMCENHINDCYDEAGVVPTDPAVACPKLQNFTVCLLGAKCDLSQDNSSLWTAYAWYSQLKAANNCSITEDGSCYTGHAVCSDDLIRDVSKDDVSGEEVCDALTDSVLCVKAAPCSQPTDDGLMDDFFNGSSYRLSMLTCPETTCMGTFANLTECQTTYDSDLAEAGTDTEQKCSAKNAMVSCLRLSLCNPYLRNMIGAKYNSLKDETLDCDMLPLEEVDDGNDASALHATVVLVLVSLLMASFLLRQ